MNKRIFLLCMALCFVTVCLCVGAAAAEVSADAAALIEDIPTNQAFTAEAADEADITAIVNAGINAPSAMNGQPWHFTVITDTAVIEQLAGAMSFGGAPGSKPSFPGGAPEGFSAPEGGMPPAGASAPAGAPVGDMPTPPTAAGSAKAGIGDAPLAIIVSCKEGSDLDAGLAAQNMSAEAQLLGYGTKVISSITIALNGEKQTEYKELLGIPENMSAVCALLIGRNDDAAFDTVTGATARNSESEIVTYLK